MKHNLEVVKLITLCFVLLISLFIPAQAGYWTPDIENNRYSGTIFISDPNATNPEKETQLDWTYDPPGDLNKSGLFIQDESLPNGFGYTHIRCEGTVTKVLKWVPENNDLPVLCTWNGISVLPIKIEARVTSTGSVTNNGTFSLYSTTSLGSNAKEIYIDPCTRSRDDHHNRWSVSEVKLGADGVYRTELSCYFVASANTSGENPLAHILVQLDVYDFQYGMLSGSWIDPGHFITDPRMGSFDPEPGGNNSGGDPVCLTSGDHMYLPSPDLVAYNPNGPNAVYQRNFYSKKSRASTNDSSPGLSSGWVDNFDVKIKETSSQPCSDLQFIMPDGGYVILRPVAQPSPSTDYDLKAPLGAPYMVIGTPSQSISGKWDYIKVLWVNSETVWTFSPIGEYTPGMKYIC